MNEKKIIYLISIDVHFLMHVIKKKLTFFFSQNKKKNLKKRKKKIQIIFLSLT